MRAVLLAALLAVAAPLLSCKGEPGSIPRPFNVLTPAPGATGVPVSTLFEWEASIRALTYSVVIATDPGLVTILEAQEGLTVTAFAPSAPLPSSTAVYWQVTAVNEKGATVSNGAPSTFNVEGPPGPFSLSDPPDLAVGVSSLPAYSWTASAVADSYHLEVATDSGFTALVVDLPAILETSVLPAVALSAGTTHYWRVTASNAYPPAAVAGPFSFTTQ